VVNEGTERRLAAVLIADLVGCSRRLDLARSCVYKLIRASGVARGD
jgi:hypothetical protein